MMYIKTKVKWDDKPEYSELWMEYETLAHIYSIDDCWRVTYPKLRKKYYETRELAKEAVNKKLGVYRG